MLKDNEASSSEEKSINISHEWESTILSVAYFPPIAYFQTAARAKNVLIEQFETYQKQTYRNRCRILTANGVTDLIIPVEKGNRQHIRDIKISEHFDWQTLHWRTIEAAYNSSPFFEYYSDDFKPLFEKKWIYLWDFNIEAIQIIFELLDIEKSIQFNEKYSAIVDNNCFDARTIIHPKKDSVINTQPYYQVFNNKFGFVGGLSIIDLLFNMGNESQLVLI